MEQRGHHRRAHVAPEVGREAQPWVTPHHRRRRGERVRPGLDRFRPSAPSARDVGRPPSCAVREGGSRAFHVEQGCRRRRRTQVAEDRGKPCGVLILVGRIEEQRERGPVLRREFRLDEPPEAVPCHGIPVPTQPRDGHRQEPWVPRQLARGVEQQPLQIRRALARGNVELDAECPPAAQDRSIHVSEHALCGEPHGARASVEICKGPDNLRLVHAKIVRNL